MKCINCNAKLSTKDKFCQNCGYKLANTIVIDNQVNNTKNQQSPQDILSILDEELKSSQINCENLPDANYIKRRSFPQKTSLSDKIHNSLLNKNQSLIDQVKDPDYSSNMAKQAYLFVVLSIIFSLSIYLSIIGLILSIVAINKADYVERLYKANSSNNINIHNYKILKILCQIALFFSLFMILLFVILIILKSTLA